MKLYYGSTVIVEAPNVEEPNYNPNFGKGFYVSTNKDTAEYWAEIKKQKILAKDKTKKVKKYINVYEFTESEDLKILDFEKISELDYRNIGKNKKNNEVLHDYDIVKGPAITEKLLKILKDYKKGKLSKEELLNMVMIYRAINEISFHSERAMKTLKFLYAEEIKD